MLYNDALGGHCPSCDMERQVTAFRFRGRLLIVCSMNANHSLCATQAWSEHMRDEVITYMAPHVDLGESMLEIGPGPGASTEWLRHDVKRLVPVELESRRRPASFGGTRGRTSRWWLGTPPGPSIQRGPSTRSAASRCFIMWRPPGFRTPSSPRPALGALRTSGVLVASDSLPSDGLHGFHVDDTCNPIDPGSLIARLQAIGFDRITIVVADILKFIAHKPVPEAEPDRCDEPSARSERRRA